MEKEEIPEKVLFDDLQQKLITFGGSLGTWEGKLTQEFNKPFKDVVESSITVYRKVNDPIFLLCGFILQMIFSFVLASGLMNEMLKTEYTFPKEKLQTMSGKLVKLGNSLNTNAFVPTLLSILEDAYENNLVPLMEKTD